MSLSTLARSAVVVPKLRDKVVAVINDDIGENALRAGDENARAAVHPRERAMAALERNIVIGLWACVLLKRFDVMQHRGLESREQRAESREQRAERESRTRERYGTLSLSRESIVRSYVIGPSPAPLSLSRERES